MSPPLMAVDQSSTAVRVSGKRNGRGAYVKAALAAATVHPQYGPTILQYRQYLQGDEKALLILARPNGILDLRF